METSLPLPLCRAYIPVTPFKQHRRAAWAAVLVTWFPFQTAGLASLL